MPRSQQNDFLQNYRFHLRAELDSTPGVDPLEFIPTDKQETTEAGFMNATTPEYTADAVEYRDGLSTFAYKQPGFPTVNDISLQRGVVSQDTAFYGWFVRGYIGEPYRCDVTLFQWGRDGIDFNGGFNPDRARQYELENAFPTRVKVAADLDASAADVSVAELDIAYEKFNFRLPRVGDSGAPELVRINGLPDTVSG